MNNFSKSNVYDIDPMDSTKETFLDLLMMDNVRIEKIVSYGQITPLDSPYIQDHDEWVVVLKGKAKLKLEDKEYILEQGEHMLIPKQTKHWVTYTYNATIWLAIHIKDK